MLKISQNKRNWRAGFQQMKLESGGKTQWLK